MGLDSEVRGFVLVGRDEISPAVLCGQSVSITELEPRLMHVFFDGKSGGYSAIKMLDASSASLPTSFGLVFVDSDTMDHPESNRVYVLRNGRMREVDVRRVEWPGETSPDLEAYFAWRHVEQYWNYRSAAERADWVNRWTKPDGDLSSIIGETSTFWGYIQLPEGKDSRLDQMRGEFPCSQVAPWTDESGLAFHGKSADLPALNSALTRVRESCVLAIGMILALDSEDSIRAFGWTSESVVELTTLKPNLWKYYRDVKFFLGYSPRA